jgi:hypothetical protein
MGRDDGTEEFPPWDLRSHFAATGGLLATRSELVARFGSGTISVNGASARRLCCFCPQCRHEPLPLRVHRRSRARVQLLPGSDWPLSEAAVNRDPADDAIQSGCQV